MKDRGVARLPTPIKWKYETLHAFRVAKRKEVSWLKDQAWRLQYGAGYFPIQAYLTLDRIKKDIKLLQEELNQKNWGK